METHPIGDGEDAHHLDGAEVDHERKRPPPAGAGADVKNVLKATGAARSSRCSRSDGRTWA